MATNENSAAIYEFDPAKSKRQAGRSGAGGHTFVGQYLSEERQSQGLSLAEVSLRTHIKDEYLAAIEANDLANMPSRPFALGFVKGYAELLGLDAGSVIEQFKLDAGFSSAVAIEAEDVPDVPERPAFDQNKDMSLLAVVFVMIFILWCAFQITRPRETGTPLRLDDFPAAKHLSQASKPLVSDAPEIPSQGAIPPAYPNMIEAAAVEKIQAVYPRKCESGAAVAENVVVTFTVTAQGRVAAERVANSTNTCFDRAALNAIRRWQFQPRTVDGIAQPAYEQLIVFPFKRPD